MMERWSGLSRYLPLFFFFIFFFLCRDRLNTRQVNIKNLNERGSETENFTFIMGKAKKNHGVLRMNGFSFNSKINVKTDMIS